MADALRQIADRVWIFPGAKNPKKVQPTVGVICTATQTVLVDSGNSPRHARRILAALEAIKAPPIAYIVYTHHHWDHVFGACVFGAPAIAHDLCREMLLQAAEAPWSHTYLQEQIRQNPLLQVSYGPLGRAVDDWRDFRILAPSITFSRTLRLPIDDLTIELEHVGGQHAADSIVVRVTEARVMFLGDCFYPAPSYLRTPQSQTDWSMLASLLEPSIDMYVDGHTIPFRGSKLSTGIISLLAKIKRQKRPVQTFRP
jgi:glyoxylase-like metal-dependent hydrolase (beta-lactamase superfamily II)